MLTACEDEELDDILPASTHEGFAAPDDWRIDCGDVPGARYAGDLWSCLNNRTRRFLSGLRLCPADGDLRGHISLFLWELGEKKLGVSFARRTSTFFTPQPKTSETKAPRVFTHEQLDR